MALLRSKPTKNSNMTVFFKHLHLNTGLALFLVLLSSYNLRGQELQDYKEYSGRILNLNTDKPLEAASLLIKGTNISSISNTEGSFVLKVPETEMDNSIVISYLGYSSKEVPIATLSTKKKSCFLTNKSEMGISYGGQNFWHLINDEQKRRCKQNRVFWNFTYNGMFVKLWFTFICYIKNRHRSTLKNDQFFQHKQFWKLYFSLKHYLEGILLRKYQMLSENFNQINQAWPQLQP